MILKNKIKKIIDALKDTDINQISISSFWGFQKIEMSKSPKGEFHPFDSSTNRSIENDKKVDTNKDTNVHERLEESETTENNSTLTNVVSENIKTEDNESEFTIINAPLVGTFYESSKPGEPPLVKIGDEIIKGQALCIVEAMKIFNEIESEFTGVIVEILIKDSEPVEYGQALFKIKEQ